MEETTSAERDWFTVFRTDEGNEWLRDELVAGRLRQGWGAPGLGLTSADGEWVSKSDWSVAHAAWRDWGAPSTLRFAILRRMLELDPGDIVVMPKMPAWNQFTIARASGRYRFELADGWDDFGHVIPVDPDSVRTFVYDACNEALLVSALFARANHRPAVSFCYDAKQLAAAQRLLELPSSSESKPRQELWKAAIDDAYRAAAKALAAEVAAWNGQVFEDAVRQCSSTRVTS